MNTHDDSTVFWKRKLIYCHMDVHMGCRGGFFCLFFKPCAVSEMLLGLCLNRFWGKRWLNGYFHFLFDFYKFYIFCFLFFIIRFFPPFSFNYTKGYIKTRLKPWIPQIFCHWVCLLIQSASMDPFFAHYQDQDCKKRRQKEHLEGGGHSEKTRNTNGRWTATEDSPHRARQWFKDQL